jgi:hypothetical protein
VLHIRGRIFSHRSGELTKPSFQFLR